MAGRDPHRECAPEDVVRRLVDRLRGRSEEILTTRQGRPLRLQVTVTDKQTQSYRIIVTATGAVALLEPANLTGEEFRPQVVIIGTAAELAAVVLGRVSWRSATDAGTLIPYIDLSEVEPFRQLVAAELSDLLGEA